MPAKLPQPSDHELVQLCRKQSREAFGLLVARYSRTVRATFLARIGRHRDLDDMVQETFLRAYNGLGRLQDGSRFAPYIRRIAHNMAVDQLRRGKREIPLDQVDLEAPDSEPKVDDRMARLRAMVGRLPEALREAVLLFYFEEMSYARIAMVLGITEAAVNQRLSRARKKLRTDLGVAAEKRP